MSESIAIPWGISGEADGWIPEEFKVIALTPLGEPDEVPSPKDRKSLDEIVSWGKFGGTLVPK